VELILIRHGETEWSRSGQHTGITDIDLLESGRAQARALAPLLGRILADRQPDAVYSSPRRRARETAALAYPGVTAEPCELLREFTYGEYEGLTIEQIRAQRPGWDIWRDGCPGGESVAEVGARADRFLAGYGERDGPVMVFSHGHMIRILAARALRLEARQGKLFLLETASVSVIATYRGEPALALWNARPELPGD
jgi:broad specificity phosphatase PhoE